MTVYLTPTEVALELNCGHSTVHAAIQRGDLPAMRYGRLVRVSREDLDGFIAKYSQPVATAPRRRRRRATP